MVLTTQDALTESNGSHKMTCLSDVDVVLKSLCRALHSGAVTLHNTRL